MCSSIHLAFLDCLCLALPQCILHGQQADFASNKVYRKPSTRLELSGNHRLSGSLGWRPFGFLKRYAVFEGGFCSHRLFGNFAKRRVARVAKGLKMTLRRHSVSRWFFHSSLTLFFSPLEVIWFCCSFRFPYFSDSLLTSLLFSSVVLLPFAKMFFHIFPINQFVNTLSNFYLTSFSFCPVCPLFFSTVLYASQCVSHFCCIHRNFHVLELVTWNDFARSSFAFCPCTSLVFSACLDLDLFSTL